MIVIRKSKEIKKFKNANVHYLYISMFCSTYVIRDLIETTKGKSIMLDRAENLLHDHFGDADGYWSVR